VGLQQASTAVQNESERDQRGQRNNAHNDHQRECRSAVQVAPLPAHGLALVASLTRGMSTVFLNTVHMPSSEGHFAQGGDQLDRD
jgi:hypothetical protein